MVLSKGAQSELLEHSTDESVWNGIIAKIGRQGFRLNLVLEYVDGGTFKSYLDERRNKSLGPLPEEEALFWLKDIGTLLLLFFGIKF